ncbi:hypothetical protein GOZ83_06440 [Agrobacterium vitis]|uniref:hypothetical protein n=1 Tax=Rhizobium/Agrobacterium group TaxID=227290 RepID=UPI0012E952BF|nr:MULTISPECIES: hypothetical protein [Rhizobium/Agrobacterium group]MCF1495855.1 hypothetical protein [Allorhizobium ampelinum]MVA44720.1 hypothetical protein [Agrobacterium vitis]
MRQGHVQQMKILQEFWGAPLPARLSIERGHGSCLLLYYEHDGNKPSMMIDRSRWIVTSGDRLAFYDYDISSNDDLAVLAPYRLQSIADYPDHMTLDFGGAQLLLFWTAQSQEFFHPGIPKDSEEWRDLPQDDRDNVTIFPRNGEEFGIEFEALLDPEDYPWGGEFLRREAELPSA